ncbi:discoidin domain-containing protein [Pseudonocardia sp. T1-2H]|uniref:discoidin domain-containing protein n=1 Tax=Pseudonocardia sp. T1-2H TaxID=3128899 RepID=UPI003100B2C5
MASPAPARSLTRPWWRRSGAAAALVALLLLGASGYEAVTYVAFRAAPPADATVLVETDRAVNSFPGLASVGAGVDGLDQGEIDRVWTPDNIDAMRSAGYGPISFRLRTELGVKAWHWNEEGAFSDAARQQGYWTSSDVVRKDAGVSHGYHLPRRGNTIDQANNDGWSRLDDGDTGTFWKSNPYLDPHFTGGSDLAQWIMIALPQALPVDTVRIAWADPYATSFRVQYWTGADAIHPAEAGDWKDFPSGVHAGTPGTQTLRVAAAPIEAQQIRILMRSGSGTAAPGSTDVRDGLGVAVREISAGYTGPGGFVDHVEHVPSQQQTRMYTSSTDPWHRASDLDPNYEHASFERTFASGLTGGRPMMVPVPVLYGIPEDAAALLRYLRGRGFPVEQVEMGEEPDGQLAEPEHYAELYRQVGRALKAVDPAIELGGPGYQTVLPDWIHWPDEKGVKSYTGRFVSYLREHDALELFDFFSFEWYPFDDVCADPAVPLAQHPTLLKDIVRRQEEAGLPPEVPKVITEYGYSSFAGQVELEMPGSIVNAETAAQFLALGGDTSYFYGLEPNWVFQEDEGKPCDTWGNLMLFQYYDDFRIRPIATLHASQLVTGQWIQAGDGRHDVHAATTDLRSADGHPMVTAYGLRRPDGRLSVLLFNKDPARTVTVALRTGSAAANAPLAGELELFSYSGEQWDWYPEGGETNGGFPEKNDPPARTVVDARDDGRVTLPPYSISVVRTEPERSWWERATAVTC